ncbi:head GIN domain-containing protein [Massilibacteroides sp.]|uniref:head GIN domain-containing protein n=1 Tax=Massilibacteroides sp. TaxID=2034766 RepID=UPI00262DC040|nr:head GIN domain-containing protein [Massilibacteroides sp.]MDD4514784.1 DUF2807 domain-containing protein [Massilibacteroides sp.]
MRTKVFILAICLFGVFTGNAENVKGNGNIVTKEIQVGDFDKIDIGGNIVHNNKLFSSKIKESYKLNYSQKAGTSSLTVTTDENLIPYLDIQSSNGRLTIRTTKRDKITPTKLVIDASSKNLNKVAVSGSMDFIVVTPFESEELNVSVSGAGDIIMKKQADIQTVKLSISGAGDVDIEKLACEKVEAKVSGAGDINLKGKADQAKFSVSGAGDVEAYDLIAKSVSASVSGAGDIEVYASEELDASVSGIGDISYKGDAKVTKKKSGLGSISKD